MKRLQNLSKLNQYLRDFSLPQSYAVTCSYVTSQADATSLLDKCSGKQVLLARPELRQTGDSDGFTDVIDTAVFVLAKDLGAGKTQAKVNTQFDELESIAEAILSKIDDDLTSGSCTLLPGFTIEEVIVTPEIQIFGSWCGFSLAITFRR